MAVKRRKSPSVPGISIRDGPSSFHTDQSELTSLVNEKCVHDLLRKDGPQRIARYFNSSIYGGISGEPDDVASRQNAFGVNTFKRPGKGLLHFLLEAFKDLTHLILLVCAGLSPGLAIKESGLREGWYSGGSSFCSVFLVIAVSAVCKYQQNRQFNQLYGASDNILYHVVRNAQPQQVPRSKIVVGDLLKLKIGDQIPADGVLIHRIFPVDGVLINGKSFHVDESSMTRESYGLKKKTVRSPFLFFGTEVVEGDDWMLVTAVGMNTKRGKMMSKMMSSINRDSSEETHLQARLNKLILLISKVSLVVNFLVLVVLQILYFMGKRQDENGKQEFVPGQTMGDYIMNSVGGKIAATVTIVSVMIPEGLPIAATLILAYSMKSLMRDQAFVRNLWACEPIRSATTICVNKTSTLMNPMEVTKFWIGQESVAENGYSSASKFVLDLIRDGVALNPRGRVYKRKLPSESVYRFYGGLIGTAIFSWAVSHLSMDVEEIRKRYGYPLNFETKKRGCVLINKRMDGTIIVHCRGAAEKVLAICSRFYDESGIEKDMDQNARNKFQKIIQGRGARGLRYIAFAHKQVCVEAKKEQKYRKHSQRDLTLLGLASIEKVCRPGVNSAVEAFRNAGVNIKMITGDNVFKAMAIAKECGILRPGDDASNKAIVKGADFRNYTISKRREEVEKIRVMARSSSSDKLLMVQCLKEKGHVVAVTGDGMNDAPALKEAHIGVSMGIQGTEVAKESSDIVIHSDNFASVKEVLRWGQCIYDNIQKFIQFKLTVNVAALLINFVAAIAYRDVPFTAIQLLWLNLIVDTLGAFALATEKPTRELMERPPVGRTEPLVTNVMWRNLVGQAIYQAAILLTLQLKGELIFGMDEAVKRTLIFNAFVLCQVFNVFNVRKLEKKNVFEGFFENKLFLGIIFVMVVLQVVMVEFLKQFAVTEQLSWGQWGACVGIAASSWPIACVVKCIPVSHTPTLATSD